MIASPATVISLTMAIALLAAFIAVEARTAYPSLPLRVIMNRNRGGAYLAALLSGAGLFGMFLFLTYYLPGRLHYSALRAGFAFPPFSLGIVVGATVTSQLLPKIGLRNLLAPGLLLGVLGLLWFTRIGAGGSYFVHVLPAEIVVSIGMGLVFVTVASTAPVGVADRDAGVASALLNPSQQIGGSLGTNLLNTVAATVAAHYLAAHRGAEALPDGLVHGYRLAFGVSALVLATGCVTAFLLIRAGRDDLPANPTPVD